MIDIFSVNANCFTCLINITSMSSIKILKRSVLRLQPILKRFPKGFSRPFDVGVISVENFVDNSTFMQQWSDMVDGESIRNLFIESLKIACSLVHNL